MEQAPKILAIQFKYLGDAAIMIPALRAIKEHRPQTVLHVLVPTEIAPVLDHQPFIARVWAMPRKRGQARIRETWPIIRALRRERFDAAVDFGGNDRGAILSLLCGARCRLGPISPGKSPGRLLCYNQRVAAPVKDQHETVRLCQILSAWQIPPPRSLEVIIPTAPRLDAAAERVLPERRVLCHIAAGQPKKEWPVRHWVELFHLITGAGYPVAFTSAIGARERASLTELRLQLPEAPILPPAADVAEFLALLKRGRLFISGDTGPLHLAAGAGVPTISLFGPTSAARWAPFGQQHQVIQGAHCSCEGRADICTSANHCLAAIRPEEVLRRLRHTLPRPSS